MSPAYKIITVADYLALDQGSEVKLEYVNGTITAMAGASPSHGLITGNVTRELGNALKAKPCQVYPSDLRVKSLRGGYMYPDVSVVCGEPQIEGDAPGTVVNPVVIVEVLSPSTEARDRSVKFEQYRSIATVKEIVFVDQSRVSVEVYTRQPSGWLLTTANELHDSLRLSSIDVTVPLAEVYAKVTFPVEATGGQP